MKDRQILRYQMFARVRDFGATHSDQFPPSTMGSDQFAVIEGVIKELAGIAATQLSGNRAASQSALTKAGLREQLCEDLVLITRTARSIAQEKPGIVDSFRMPQRNNDQLLINAARSFSADASEFSTEFFRFEMPADFIVKLNQKIELFEKA